METESLWRAQIHESGSGTAFSVVKTTNQFCFVCNSMTQNLQYRNVKYKSPKEIWRFSIPKLLTINYLEMELLEYRHGLSKSLAVCSMSVSLTQVIPSTPLAQAWVSRTLLPLSTYLDSCSCCRDLVRPGAQENPFLPLILTWAGSFWAPYPLTQPF